MTENVIAEIKRDESEQVIALEEVVDAPTSMVSGDLGGLFPRGNA